MIIIDYKPQFHQQIIKSCVESLQLGKIVAYPTDTSYGLAADAFNATAVRKLYKIKERGFNKPVHVVVPSMAYAKKIAVWSTVADRLGKKFWPGPVTLILPIHSRAPQKKMLEKLSAGTGFIGLRYPNNNIALDLARRLKHPITATSANPSLHLSGGYDSYSAEDVMRQFSAKKYQPGSIINAGKLPKRKPSTVVKIDGHQLEILRPGPILEKEIFELL